MAWQLDTGHTLIEFAARHLGIATVKGRFNTFEGAVVFDESDLTASSVEVTIDAASIDSGNAKRDSDLREPRFLDTEQFPSISFRSTGIQAHGPAYKMSGDLTIHGVTRPVALDLAYGGVTKDRYGNTKAGFSASTEIDRREFGLTNVEIAELGAIVIGERIRLSLEVELKQA